MAFAATADPARFDEAIAWFRDRFPLTDSMRAAFSKYAGERAWWVAGVGQLDVLLDVFQGLERAIANGQTLDDWKKEFGPKLARAWGRENPFRVETIYRTNVHKAYNAGRWRQLQSPALKRSRPYRFFDAILDGRTSDICNARDGTLLPADDPFWLQNVPPLHHRCRSTIRALTEREAQRKGGAKPPDPEGPPPDGTFGAPPEVDVPWRPDLTKYPPELREAFLAKVAAQNQAGSGGPGPKKSPAPKASQSFAMPLKARGQALYQKHLALTPTKFRRELETYLETEYGITQRAGLLDTRVLIVPDSAMPTAHGEAYFGGSKAGLTRIRATRYHESKHGPDQGVSFATFIHEQLHHSTKRVPKFLGAKASALEEATVETTTRRIAVDMGFSMANRTSYQRLVDDLRRAFALSGVDQRRMENGLIKMRGNTRTITSWGDYVDRIMDQFKSLPKQQRDDLRARLEQIQ